MGAACSAGARVGCEQSAVLGRAGCHTATPARSPSEDLSRASRLLRTKVSASSTNAFCFAAALRLSLCNNSSLLSEME
eukprot:2798981-Prymnesium_polylepis.1